MYNFKELRGGHGFFQGTEQIIISLERGDKTEQDSDRRIRISILTAEIHGG